VADREAWLAATLVELADTSAIGDFDDVDVDESGHGIALACRLAELFPQAEIGVLVQDPAGIPHIAATSSERSRKLLCAELDEDDGPCVVCYRTGERMLNLDIATLAQRWPWFAPFAEAAEFRAVTALPMRRHGDIVGAAGILDATGAPLAEPDVDLAQMLLEAATVGLRQRRRLAQVTRVTEQLQYALDSRVMLEQAKGMTAASLDITPNEAFTLLRGYARGHNRLLTDVAVEVIRRELTAADLLAPRRPISTR
jgi:hypothetical protein